MHLETTQRPERHTRTNKRTRTKAVRLIRAAFEQLLIELLPKLYRTDRGRSFAHRHDLAHVTFVFFDGGKVSGPEPLKV
ncbi:MAG: hypothetical protein ACI9W2_003312 [Gammaproteobacteria bacterium]|jgi:hypothetical protein